ncbi:MAG: hypothetical protein KC443_04955, partial [Anaerolineales bacterium]|nr:hypothetical protein [Anaerolineales bacterium]
MTNIHIRLKEPTIQGRLYYQPDKQIEEYLVYLRSPIIRKIAYSINITGGLIILGVDENSLLKDIELNILRRNWREGNVNVMCFSRVEADIQFVNLTAKHIDLEFPVHVTRDKFYSKILVSIGKIQNP